ncbi:Cell cycle checkpoint protein RAD1, partial [Ooceraea biroi]
SVSYQNLLKLSKLFGSVFERALDLYEQKRVTQISTSNAIITECKSAKEASWLMQIKGHSGALYTLFPEVNYCTCIAFRQQVLNDRSVFTCKHVLAAWLASVDTEKLLHQQLTQKQFDGLLLNVRTFTQTAICLGSKKGLKITVEDARCMQASAYIPTEVFDEFESKEDATFSINLNILVECLCMFWPTSQEDSITVQMFYKVAMQQCNNVIRRYDIILRLSPEEPFFRISTNGLGGTCHIDLPHESSLIDTFQCTSTAISNFKLSHIKPAMKPLSCANRVSLRTNDAGLLCFQYMIKTENGHTCFIEYYVRFFIRNYASSHLGSSIPMNFSRTMLDVACKLYIRVYFTYRFLH